LNAVDAALVVFDSGHDIAGGCRLVKALGKFGDVVAVAHPNVELKGHFGKQLGLTAKHLERCMAILAAFGGLAFASEIDGDKLHSVTDAQDGAIHPVIKIRGKPWGSIIGD